MVTKFCIVNKVGIGKTGPYVIFAGWLFDTQAQAHEALHKEAFYSKHPDKYTIAKVEYEDAN